MTHRTVYRRTDLLVTLTTWGTIQSVTTRHEESLTDLMTDEQKAELLAQVKKEIEDDDK